jgi:hypothetical protein
MLMEEQDLSEAEVKSALITLRMLTYADVC